MSFKKRGVVISGRQPVAQRPSDDILSHEGVKPSVLTSQPTTSTGCADLDGLLGHWGLPLGHSLLVEETGTTDFASILLRSFGAQGVLHNRASGKTIIAVIGADDSWARELPGVYKDKKTIKREKVQEQESKVSVGNMSDKNMKIAWRYTRPNATNANSIQVTSDNHGTKQNYNVKLDFTTRLVPTPTRQEVVSLGNNLVAAVNGLDRLCAEAATQNTIVRVVVPSLLHPAIFPAEAYNQALPFLHCLRVLCRKYPTTLVAMTSISLELLPRHNAITRFMEHAVDGIIHLDPFKTPLSPESNEKQDQGLIHIYKLPSTSEKGAMVKRLSEHSFRVGRKQFEIKEFGIPVDESETDSKPNPIDY